MTQNEELELPPHPSI